MKKSNNLLTIGLIGVGIYLLTKQQQPPRYNYYPQYPQIPPAPPPNTPQWQQWVSLVVNSLGVVANLWAPGGPFYNQPLNQTQAIEIGQGTDYSDYA
jgi:hypothetical protein